MNLSLRLAFTLTALLAGSHGASAASYTVTLQPGFNSLANQLNNVCALSSLIPNPPGGTRLFKFNAVAQSFAIATFDSDLSEWMPNLNLCPGEGAILCNPNPTPFMLTITGSPRLPVLPLTLRTNGYNLVGRQTNATATFEQITGFAPPEGTRFYQLIHGFGDCANNAPPPTNTSAYLQFAFSNGVWHPTPPVAAVGEAVWIFIPAEQPVCGPVRIRSLGANGVVEWSGACRLQVANDVTGPWADVPGATSPYTAAFAGSQRFFRTISLDGSFCSPNVVGYVNRRLLPGLNLIANPLNGTNNNLNTILSLANDGSQDGMRITRFDGAVPRPSILWEGGTGWNGPGSLVIDPGEGFMFQNVNAAAFDVTFVGEVPQGFLVNPLPPAGLLAYRSSQVPQTASLTSLGFPAEDGDVVLIHDAVTQVYKAPYLYEAGVGWSSSNPDDPGPAGPILPVGTGFVIQKSGMASIQNWTRSFAVGCDGPPAGPPTIVQSPVNQTVVQGATAMFTVAATGTAPLFYQWFFNNAPLPARTSATLTISNAQPADEGAYFVQVSNPFGSSNSAPATLTVVTGVPPSIVAQPQGLTVPAGLDATFCVVATGTAPLQFRWRFNGAALPNATNALLRVTNVAPGHAGNYTCLVSNALGTVASAGATLTVSAALVPPVITSLSSTTALSGEVITLTGTNFGNNPEDLCVVLDNGGRVLGCEVLFAQNSMLKVRLPVIPTFAAGLPHLLKVGRGVGIRGCIVPLFPDLEVIAPPWLWLGQPNFMAVAPAPFFPLFAAPPRAVFHSGLPAAGALTLVIDGDWGPGALVSLTARILRAGASGVDVNFSNLRFTASGSRLDCANRLCDVLQKAFAQHGLAILCNVALVGGNAVLTITLPGGEAIVAGALDLIVLRGPPVIVGVSPPSAVACDIITISGTNFGTVPDDLCVVLQHPNGATFGCEVLFAQDTMLKVKLPFIPIWAGGVSHMLKIGRGPGVRGCPVPAFPDVVLIGNPWVWMGQPFFGVAVPFVPIFAAPPRPAFHSGGPTNGVLKLVLDGDWGAGTVVKLTARILRPNANGVDINFHGVKFTAAGDRLDCADRICELLTQTFAARGLPVVCTVAQAFGNGVITIALPGGEAIVAGVITVEVEAAGPIILGVTPGTGAPCDLVTITGSHFGDVPDDLCVILAHPSGKVFGCEVLFAQDTMIKIKLPRIPIWAGGTPCQLKIARGLGVRGCPVPGFNDVLLVGNPWVWAGFAEFAAMIPFTPIFAAPPQPVFHSGPPTNGALRLVLDGDWGPGTIVSLTARILKPSDFGVDINFHGVEFTAAGTRFDCALRICDVLRQTFAARNRAILCDVTMEGTNAVLTVRCANGEPIAAGTIDVEVLPAAPVIVSVTPGTGPACGLVTIAGHGFGERPDDLCVVLMHPSGKVLGCEVLFVQDAMLKIKLPLIPAWAAGVQCQLKIVRGLGVRGCPVPGFNDVLLVGNPWVWAGFPRFVAMAPFVPLFVAPPQPVFHSGPPTNGSLRLVLDADWGAGTVVSLAARILKASDFGVDIHFHGVKFTAAGSRLDCAQRLCDLLVQTFAARNRRILCDVTQEGANAVITVRCANGEPILAGTIDVAIQEAAPVITVVTPPAAPACAIITIEGQHFGDDPDNLCVVLMAPNGKVHGCEVLFAQDTMLKIKLPIIPPGFGGIVHKLKIVRGLGVRGCPVPAFNDVVLLGNPWCWQGFAEFMAMADFTPIFAAPPRAVFHSGPPVNGALRLVLDGDWGAGTVVTLGARILKASDYGVDINFSGVRFTAAGSRFDCALRICDLLQQAFASRNRPIRCDVTMEGGNAVITVRCVSGEPIIGGTMDLAVLQDPPVITGLSATTGGPGTVLVIEGANFGALPDDICVVLEREGRVIGLPVLVVRDTLIKVYIPDLPAFAGGLPHNVKIGWGHGVIGCLVGNFGPLVVVNNPWVWLGIPAFMAMAPVPFTPVFAPPPRTVFHSSPPSGGTLSVTLNGDWVANQSFTLTARILKAADFGVDVNFSGLRFTSTGGGRLDCAQRLCDLLVATFGARGRAITCTVTLVGGNPVLTVALVSGEPIVAGTIDIILDPPPPPALELVLTPSAIARGFALTTFAVNFPQAPAGPGGIGPLGMAFRPDGRVLVTDHPGDSIYLFPSDTDGQDAATTPISASHVAGRPTALAQIGGPAGFRYYLALQALVDSGAGRIVEVDANGAFVQNIVNLDQATGLVPVPTNAANPALAGKLLASQAGGTPNRIFVVDPVAKTLTQFGNRPADGLCFSPDGTTLYLADGGNVIGLSVANPTTQTFALALPATVGLAAGQDALAGRLYVNCANGEVWEVEVATSNKTLIAFCGTRGDFALDNLFDASLFLTQSDRIKRLRYPGARFFAGPGAEAVPAPPPIVIQPAGSMLKLSWPATALGFRLEGTMNLVPPNWVPVPVPPAAAGGMIQLEIPASGPRQFFQLRER